MVKKADIGSKRLISLDPTAWAQWVTQDPTITTQEILSSEFQWISRESDILIKASSSQQGEFLILIEIQLRYSKHMPRRMRAYSALAEERYGLPVYPVLITLLPPSKNTIIPDQYRTTFMGLHAQQDYHLIKLWEVDAQLAFQPELNALLPFVPIMEGGNSQTVVQEAVRALRQVETLTDFEPLLAFFANFVLESSLIQQIMRWDMVILEQSSWYNEILNRGKQSGRQEGRQEEAVSLLLKQLNRRVGQLSGDLTQAISALSLEQLESLGEEIFDFSTPADLQQWLANSQ
jgi:predicted transposase YdaD